MLCNQRSYDPVRKCVVFLGGLHSLKLEKNEDVAASSAQVDIRIAPQLPAAGVPQPGACPSATAQYCTRVREESDALMQKDPGFHRLK